ncbi:MAG TPA: thermonuclease family protein [Anaeromyxobacteraceae bacterium]|nr:thermonuclease family protein [Anaeromyxobacteraceae bacterium]
MVSWIMPPGAPFAAALVLLAVPGAPPSIHPGRGEPRGRAGAEGRARRPAVTLDGAPRAVRWIDGDTFRILDGPAAGRSARLAGYNALESYGPVHRWGAWRPEELLAIAREATRLARAGEWRCTSRDGEDRYGRLLVSCPDAALALVESGLAMVFAVDAPPDEALVAAQLAAQARGSGMWRRGVPPLAPSSLHSADEPDLAGAAYDRVVDTSTGRAEPRRHQGTYRVCQEVCVGEGRERACMTYVPFARRYRDRPACLRAR